MTMPTETTITQSFQNPSPIQTFDDLIGKGLLFQELITQARLVAQTDCRVLLIGEEGSGKETLARSIHHDSSRRHSPFRTLQCATFHPAASHYPLHLWSQEGSAPPNDSFFDTICGGTLYLDEVGALCPDAQTWFLRFLLTIEMDSLNKLNSGRDEQFRIIAGTTRNLQEDVTAGRFRAELFYRLNVVSLHVPPLRHRQEDIRALAAHFVALYSGKYGKSIKHITEKTFEVLHAYLWPRNIEELERLIERAIILSNDNTLHVGGIAYDLTNVRSQS